jgi:copper chaperone NosL
MATAATAVGKGAGAREQARETATDRGVRLAVGALAAAMVVIAAWQPVWQARLSVLQYPTRPLVLTAYPDRLEGDVDEIDILNHYVGLKAFDMAELPETVLWFPTIVAALVAVGIVTFLSKGSWLRRLALLGLWGIPVGVLLVVQYRLYELGHSMDPAAAFRQAPFTPPVVGEAQVASNVATTAWPGEALLLIAGAALLLTIGPAYVGFIREFVTAGRPEEEEAQP